MVRISPTGIAVMSEASAVHLRAAMTEIGDEMTDEMIAETVHQLVMAPRQAMVLLLQAMADHLVMAPLQVMAHRRQAMAHPLLAMEPLQATAHLLQAMVHLLRATVRHRATVLLVELLQAMAHLHQAMARHLQVMVHLLQAMVVLHLGRVDRHQAMVGRRQATAGRRQAMVDLLLATAHLPQIRMALQGAKVVIHAIRHTAGHRQGAMHLLVVHMALQLLALELLRLAMVVLPKVLEDPRLRKLHPRVMVVQADQHLVDLVHMVLHQAMSKAKAELHRTAMEVHRSHSQLGHQHCQQDGSR